jgi:AraC-like DNA-binding protein
MTVAPVQLTDRPTITAEAMDPLSEVLRSVRLMGGVFLEARFTAPWCVTSKIAPEDCRPFMETPAQVIAYHFVIEGRMLIEVDGHPIEVDAGEVAMLPRNDAHILASASGLEPVDAGALIRPGPEGGLSQISHGGGGAAVHLVCGFLASEDSYNPLIASLPRILKLDFRQCASREWVEASVRFAARALAEGRFAASNMMSRLSELLFVEAVRSYASDLDDREVGWLRGLNDPYVGRALALIHGKISAPWTAEALAKEVALSRSAFVERFASEVGMPPIRYLTFWRLQTAKLLLREVPKPVAQHAYSVGYESEAAFSRAFKREFGVSPAQWRDQQ